jgi:hypothetical protein
MMAISLTPAESRLRDYLIALAAGADPADPAANTMRYSDIADAVDQDGSLAWNRPHANRLITALWHVNQYEVQRGRPMVGAFSVTRTRSSIKGFANAGRDLDQLDGSDDADNEPFWREQLKRSAEYWAARWNAGAADAAQPGLSDTQYDAIMAELATLKRMVRALAHS